VTGTPDPVVVIVTPVATPEPVLADAPVAPAGDDAPVSDQPSVGALADTPQLYTAFEPPENLELPMITGTAQYGQTLHVSTGTWTGDPTPTFTYQWQHCGDDDCTDIAAATGADYTLVAADIGFYLSATVTAHNSEGDIAESSDNWSDEVEGILPTGPAPTIAGIARVGETLTASVGAWTGPTELTQSWMWGRCEGLYACSTIEGANSPTYTITADDLGAILVARVDFSGPLGRDGMPSEPTAPVVAAPAAGRDANVTNTGNTITVSGSGFGPDTDVTVVLHSDPVTLGIAHTDANGNFTATFTIPSGVPAGDHTLVFTGVDAAGNPIVVEQAVTLTGTMTASPRAATGAILPVTGIDALALALSATGLLFAGAVALLAGRRRAAPVS
jgi:hypothetical protein